MPWNVAPNSNYSADQTSISSHGNMVLMFVLYCNLGNIWLTQFARVEISRRIRIFEATCYAITANHTIMELYLLIRRAFCIKKDATCP